MTNCIVNTGKGYKQRNYVSVYCYFSKAAWSCNGEHQNQQKQQQIQQQRFKSAEMGENITMDECAQKFQRVTISGEDCSGVR